MKKFLVILFSLFALQSFAQDEDVPPPEDPVDPIVTLNPYAPVVRLLGGVVAEQKLSIPDVFKNTINYKKMTHKHYADGWRQAQLVPVTNSVTIAIPQDIQDAGGLYQSMLEGALGAGAHTNTAFSYDQVVKQMTLDTNFTVEVGIRLDNLRKIMLPWCWPTKHTYNFPYGDTNLVRTVVAQKIEQIPE